MAAPATGRDRGGRASEPELRLRLDVFEGPLDLLLHLIERDELDIHDIPVARVTEQYLSYLGDLHAVDLDRAADFLVMAATLCEIKARLLLPRAEAPRPEDGAADEPPPADPRAELVARLLEYSRFKAASHLLAELAARRGLAYPPAGLPPLPPAAGRPLGDVGMAELLAAFASLVARRGPLPVREIGPEPVSVQQRMEEIGALLRSAPGGRVRFSELFPPNADRALVVATFLALLELIRLRLVRAHQAEALGEIDIAAAPDAAQRSAGVDG